MAEPDGLADRFDVVVIGAGAGGLFTAARLAHQGLRTLVIERRDRIGGRASTQEIDGFLVNEGAIVIEVGGITEETFAEVGARFDVREPSPPLLYRIKGKDVDVTGGGWGFLMSRLTRHGAKLLGGLGAARQDEGLPADTLSTADWVAGFTKNEAVHGIFRNMCASIFAVSSQELPARVFLTYFTRKTAFKRFGFCPQGTIGVWQALADVVTGRGGEVWVDAEVDRVTTEAGRVEAVHGRRHGQPFSVTASAVVSDIGPFATLDLVDGDALSEDYRREVTEGNRPCAMISINFASQKPLMDAPGMLSFASTRRMCYVASFTGTCPEMAPDGWHLYVGASVPEPSIGNFDADAEIALLKEDLRDELPGFEHDAKILSVAVTRDGWPPQRAVAGFDLPYRTPIANLWNVGDAVKQYANGGTTACAETAKIVATEVVALLQPAAAR